MPVQMPYCYGIISVGTDTQAVLAEKARHQTAFASKECSGTRGPLGCVNAGNRCGNAAAASSQSRRSPCTHAVARGCNGCLRFDVRLHHVQDAACMHMHDAMVPTQCLSNCEKI